MRKITTALFAMLAASFAQSQELSELPLIDADGYQAGILQLPGDFLQRDECADGMYGGGAFVLCGPFWVQGLPDDFRFYLAGAAEVAGSPAYGDQSMIVNPSGNDDHGNGQITATMVSLSSTIEGQLHIGDSDYFRIDITEPVTIRMATFGETDTYGELYNNSGNRIGFNEDGGEGKNFQIAASLQEGIYYLVVSGYNDSSAGQYTLSISENLDGGNSFESATTIGIPSSTSGEIDISEKDFFRFDMIESGNILIGSSFGFFCDGNPGPFDTYGTLYDSSGNIIAQHDDVGNGNDNFVIEQLNLDAGTYYVEVKGFDITKTGCYALNIVGSWNVSDPITVLNPEGGNSPKRVVVEWSCSKEFSDAEIEVPYLPRYYKDNFGDGHRSDAIVVMSGCVAESYKHFDRIWFKNYVEIELLAGEWGGGIILDSNISNIGNNSLGIRWNSGEDTKIYDSFLMLIPNQNESGETKESVFELRIRSIESNEILGKGNITIRRLSRIK